MEKIPHKNEKFEIEDVEGLIDVLKDFEHTKEVLDAIYFFLQDHGYGSNLEEINKLAIMKNKFSPEKFKEELEKIARES